MEKGLASPKESQAPCSTHRQKNRYTPPKQRRPSTTERNIAVPPQVFEMGCRKLTRWERERNFIDRHHLYFPKFVFVDAGKLAAEFREHRINIISLPRFQHDRLHARYHDHMERYPKYLLPSREVMASFLTEAHLLDQLDVSVRAIDMIDSAFYDDRVTNFEAMMANRDAHIENIRTISAVKFELVVPSVAKAAISSAERALAA